MRRCILLLLCLFLLTGCRTGEECRSMRRQLDYASGKEVYPLPSEMKTEAGDTMEQQVICKDDRIEVLALGLYESNRSYCIPVSIRNLSDTELGWSFRSDCTVNGWLGTAYQSSYEDRVLIPKGMIYLTLELDQYDLQQVVRPGVISGEFSYYADKGDFPWQDVPFTLNTSAGEGENRLSDNVQTLWEQDGLTAWCARQSTYYGSTEFLFCVENNADAPYTFRCDSDPRPNGEEGANLSEWWFSFTLSPGQKKCVTLSLYPDQLQEMGYASFDDLERLDFDMEVQRDYGSANLVTLSIQPQQANG